VKLYIDSSVFLHLVLEGEWADAAEKLLEAVERGEVVGYVSALVVEEVAFKLVLAKASELGVTSFWEVRRRLARDPAFRSECFKPVLEFDRYLDRLAGLAWVHVTREDYRRALEIASRHGLLTADAIHAALAMRLGAPIATFDEDFKRVPGLAVAGLT